MDEISRINRRQCMATLIMATIVVVCVCIGVVMNLVTLEDENFDHMGIETFCMFTVNSNILAAISMFLLIPYAIDGLKKGHFHIPKWVAVFAFVMVTGVTLTFLISLFVLSPVKGFVLIFTGSRFFLHGVCPILSMVTFCFFVPGYRIRHSNVFLCLIPVFIYASVYFIMVVVIGESRGGWNDFYGFATRVPFWVSGLVVLPLTYCIALMLRYAHNQSYEHHRRKAADEYWEAYELNDIEQIITHMAEKNGRICRYDDFMIPRKAIRTLIEADKNDQLMNRYCELYLRVFLESSDQARKITEDKIGFQR